MPCKNLAIEDQREHRDIRFDDLTSALIFYNFMYNRKYLIVPMDDLEKISEIVKLRKALNEKVNLKDVFLEMKTIGSGIIDG